MGELAVVRQFATHDPEQAAEWLRRSYSNHRWARLPGNPDTFRYSHKTIDCGPFVVGYADHALHLRNEWDPADELLMFVHVLGGRLTVGAGSSDTEAGAGDVVAFGPTGDWWSTWVDPKAVYLRVSRSEFLRSTAQLTGRTPRFDIARAQVPAASQRWKHLLRYASEFAGVAAAADCTLATREIFRTLVATAVETFPVEVAPTGGAAAPPAAVRRAIEYLHAHAGADLDLVDIARAAGVGPRALQRAFRRWSDTTPLGYLRTVRLQRAHEELVAPPDGATVASVAMRWGFHHAGRFAADYQRAFGVSPQCTLHPHRARNEPQPRVNGSRVPPVSSTHTALVRV